MAPDQSFYSQGLRFSCTRCSTCCRYESGFVFLSEKDAALLMKSLGLDYVGFIETYCRWIPSKGGTERLSLKETPNLDCIFWKDGCSRYEARPLQCRAFPFWREVMVSSKTWNSEAASCPGMGKGALFTRNDIEALLKEQASEPFITRREGF